MKFGDFIWNANIKASIVIGKATLGYVKRFKMTAAERCASEAIFDNYCMLYKLYNTNLKLRSDTRQLLNALIEDMNENEYIFLTKPWTFTIPGFMYLDPKDSIGVIPKKYSKYFK